MKSTVTPLIIALFAIAILHGHMPSVAQPKNAADEGLLATINSLRKQQAALENRIDQLEKHSPRAFVYCDTRTLGTSKRGVGCVVTKPGANTYRITFDKPFVQSEYVALLSSTGKAELTRNTSTEIDVFTANKCEFWVAIFGELAPQ